MENSTLSNYSLRRDHVIIPGTPTEFIPSVRFLTLFQTKMGYIFLRGCFQYDSLILEFISFCVPTPDFSLVRQNYMFGFFPV